MKDDELALYNERGLIPGPLETEDAFLKRIDFCIHLKKKALLPLDSAQFDQDQESKILAKPLEFAKTQWGMAPDWVPVFFSNRALWPWHGGAAWIFQTEEKGPLGAFLQLRRAMLKQAKYLGIYNRDELIAHEFAHIGRMAFEEKKYEELLAYQSAQDLFTRYVGPILQSSFESKLFVFTLITLLLMDLFFVFQGAWDAYLNFMWLKAIPFVLILLGFTRLYKRQRILGATKLKLQSLYGQKKGLATLFRLTDDEIERFAGLQPQEIRAYAEKQTSLRWRAIASLSKNQE